MMTTYFAKIAHVTKIRQCNFFKHGFISEVREKSSPVNLRNAILEIYTHGFFSNFENEAVFEKNYTACDAKIFKFLKMWHILVLQNVTNVFDFYARYSPNISKRMLCILKIRIWSSFKGIYFLVQIPRGTELCATPQSVSYPLVYYNKNSLIWNTKSCRYVGPNDKYLNFNSFKLKLKIFRFLNSKSWSRIRINRTNLSSGK